MGIEPEPVDSDAPHVATAELSGAGVELRPILEALLLVADAPVPENRLADAAEATSRDVGRCLREWSAELTARKSGMDLRASDEGWRLYTRRDYAPHVERLLLDGAKSKLTRAALETLAVIAYRQPVTRARIAAVRGVNVDGVVRSLVARGLIVEAGNDDETGGVLYRTTELFLDRMGLGSIGELPDIAPLLPDIDVVDELSDDPEDDPRIPLYRRARGNVETVDSADADSVEPMGDAHPDLTENEDE